MADQEQPQAEGRSCYNCGEVGHIRADCPNPPVEGAAPKKRDRQRRERQRRCFNCGKPGHQAAACPAPAGNTACYECGGEGHKARDCPSKGAAPAE